jgi:N-acyl-D-amino-acid deacylase
MSDENDIQIKNATIVDGTGSPAYKGDIVIKGERIVTISKERPLKEDAKTVINAKGLMVTPGFIDVHNHGDQSILYYPRADGFVRQGITTFVGGQCGNSPGPFGEYIGLPWMIGDIHTDVAPKMHSSDWLIARDLLNPRHKELYGWEYDWNTMGEFFKRVEAKGLSPNYVPLVGHGNIRSLVMGTDFKRPAKKKEIKEMQEHTEHAMEDGCRGITVGRTYDPATYAEFDEILACAKVAARYGGIYTSHCFSSGSLNKRKPWEQTPTRVDGVLEVIEVGRKAKMSVQISHLGSQFTVNPGENKIMTEAAIRATLKIIDDAREEGIDVNFDVIPNHLSGGIFTVSYLISILVPWLKVAGSTEQLVKALKMKDFREEVMAKIKERPSPIPTGPDERIIKVCKDERFVGKTIVQVAKELNLDPIDAVIEVLMADPMTKVVRKETDDWAKIEFYKHPEMMIGVDTFAVNETMQGRHAPWMLPSENSYGGFPRYLKRAVRETKSLSWEEAIRKVTSLPARKHKLFNRGVIKTEAYADIVILNPETVTDKGNALEPRQYPEGIEHVIVNGTLVVKNSKHTGALPGKILYRE